MTRWITTEQGSALLYVTVVIALMLIMAGVAIDLAYLTTAKAEIQRSMDAAALAGAGQLITFDDDLSDVFSNVRQWALDYARRNPYHDPVQGTIELASSNIVLGAYDGTTFAPSPPAAATTVNAVHCQWTTQIRTSFLRLIGFPTLTVGAMATAVANPPSTVPPGVCVFPIGVSACPFEDGGQFGAQGCGAVLSFINSLSNTAAWVNVTGSGTATAPSGPYTGTPSALETRNAVAAAFNGTGCNTANGLAAGEQTGAQNGMDQSVFDDISRCNPGNGTNCEGYFNTKYDTSPAYTVTDANGQPTYEGPGWEVFVPVIQTDCPPGPINGNHLVLTYSRFVITQVINRGWCGVANHTPGNPWDSLCPPPNGASTEPRESNRRAIFGYYECSTFDDVPPVRDPAPRAALATRLRLVQ